MKGGYQLLDLGKRNITPEAPITVPGLFERIEGACCKLPVLSGIVITDVEKRDCVVTPVFSGGSYELTTLYGTFTVSAEDLVSFELPV